MSSVFTMSTSEPARDESSLPQGGLSIAAGGDGIFLDPLGQAIQIWVDPRIRSARGVIKAAEVHLIPSTLPSDGFEADAPV